LKAAAAVCVCVCMCVARGLVRAPLPGVANSTPSAYSRMINFDCQEHAPTQLQARRARRIHAAYLVARNTLRAANLPALTNQATLHHGGGLECQACARYDSDGVPWYVRGRLCSGPPSLTFCAAGAGKTTLLNHVLRHTPTTRIAVIENEVMRC